MGEECEGRIVVRAHVTAGGEGAKGLAGGGEVGGGEVGGGEVGGGEVGSRHSRYSEATHRFYSDRWRQGCVRWRQSFAVGQPRTAKNRCQPLWQSVIPDTSAQGANHFCCGKPMHR